MAIAPAESEYVTANIEDLQVGDIVLATNPETGELQQRRIVDALVRTAYRLRVLSIRGPDGQEGLLRTTDEHPFWAVDRDAFVPAGELQPGEQLLAPDGQPSTLAASAVEEHPEGVAVYNFEVEGAHTYFVLPGNLPTLHSLPVLVHNAVAGGCNGNSAAETLPKLKGKPHSRIRQLLKAAGFNKTKASSVGNETWDHGDGVTVHALGALS